MVVVAGSNTDDVVSDIQAMAPAYPHIAAVVLRNRSMAAALSVAAIPSVHPGEEFWVRDDGESSHVAVSANPAYDGVELVVAMHVGSNLHVRVLAPASDGDVPFGVQISGDGRHASVTLPSGATYAVSMMAHLVRATHVFRCIACFSASLL